MAPTSANSPRSSSPIPCRRSAPLPFLLATALLLLLLPAPASSKGGGGGSYGTTVCPCFCSVRTGDDMSPYWDELFGEEEDGPECSTPCYEGINDQAVRGMVDNCKDIVDYRYTEELKSSAEREEKAKGMKVV